MYQQTIISECQESARQSPEITSSPRPDCFVHLYTFLRTDGLQSNQAPYPSTKFGEITDSIPFQVASVGPLDMRFDRPI